MNPIAEWFRSHNLSSHAFAALAIGLAGVITEDEQVRSFLVGALVNHPKIASEVILAASIVVKYSRSTSPAGAVTNVVTDAVNAPGTVTAVAVSSTSPATQKETP